MKKKNNKFLLRKNKSKKLRKKNKNINLNRFIVYRTPKHIYAQILSLDEKKVEISASTLEKKIIKNLFENKIYSGNKKAAEIIGKKIAERSIKKGIKNVYFDRSGLKFHGRIKVLAENARINGLIF